MEDKATKSQADVLLDIRSKLKLKRGYGSRIAKKLKVTRKEVYDVSWGRNKDAKILAALMEEARACEQEGNPYDQLITKYINKAA